MAGVSERGRWTYRLVRRRAPAQPALADDPAQRAIVDHTDGPLLVVGGPGTGKTTVLVEAVAARVRDGVDPQRILVLTFGRRGAARLRDAIEARIAGELVAGGEPTDRPRTTTQPLVRTFHAYAFGILRRAAAEQGEPAPRLLTGAEQDAVIRELVRADPDDDPVGWPGSLRAALATRAFAGQLRDLLLRAAERGIGPDELAEHGRRLGRPDWVAAARFMEQYVQVLALRDATSRGSIAYDNAEIVRAASALLADDPALLAAERQRLSYVYVDELADTDPAQVELLALVAGEGKPLVAFGDPDSSTYAFRGADPSIVRTFAERFRTATGSRAPTVTLTRCYRAHPTLLAATRRVARRLRGPVGHRALTPAAPPESGAAGQPVPPAVEVRTFRSATSEAAYVAHRLREAHLVYGLPWSRMAVVMRSTARHLAPVQRALAQAEVPTVTHAEDLPLHAQPAVAPLLLLLRCALRPERLDEDAAVALLHSPLGGADPMAERRLRQGLRAMALAAGDRRSSGELLVAALRDPAELAAIERRWAAPARAVARLLETARAAAARPGATAEDVLWAVWEESGLAQRWAAASLRGDVRGGGTADEHRAAAADRDLDAVVALFDAAARFADRLPGAGVEVFLDHVQSQQLPADSIAPTADRGDAVEILTAHAAKGREWDVVAVVGVQEGVWPDLRLRGSLLGSETLVDVVEGRSPEGGAGVAAASQTAALLDEERRLFYVAVTRARRRLLVTAVASGTTGEADGEEQPSRFLDELTGEGTVGEETSADDVAAPAVADEGKRAGVAGDEHAAAGGEEALAVPPRARPPTRLPRALTLPALVAELRTVVTDPAASPTRRRTAAAQLAKLAAAGVRGAHPDEWWGLRPLSDDRPLDPVPVTPSTVESALRCGLQWLLRRHGGNPPATAQQGIGNLVHAAAMLAGDDADPATLADRLAEYVGERFDAIELAARWLAERERARADQMIAKFVRWLAANPRRVAAIERDFEVTLDDGVRLRGRVDRLEVDADGRLVVVDLKTGASKPTVAELAEHPQLGAYQVAVEAGAFADVGTESGGAVLVQLGDKAKSAGEQVQPPLRDASDPGWARAMVRRAADTMAAATFEAVANSGCRACPVRTSCPISGKGRQL
jgi:superfamily I DNA/RNA helicase/RecB family exonuclease